MNFPINPTTNPALRAAHRWQVLQRGLARGTGTASCASTARSLAICKWRAARAGASVPATAVA